MLLVVEQRKFQDTLPGPILITLLWAVGGGRVCSAASFSSVCYLDKLKKHKLEAVLTSNPVLWIAIYMLPALSNILKTLSKACVPLCLYFKKHFLKNLFNNIEHLSCERLVVAFKDINMNKVEALCVWSQLTGIFLEMQTP